MPEEEDVPIHDDIVEDNEDLPPDGLEEGEIPPEEDDLREAGTPITYGPPGPPESLFTDEMLESMSLAGTVVLMEGNSVADAAGADEIREFAAEAREPNEHLLQIGPGGHLGGAGGVTTSDGAYTPVVTNPRQRYCDYNHLSKRYDVDDVELIVGRYTVRRWGRGAEIRTLRPEEVQSTVPSPYIQNRQSECSVCREKVDATSASTLAICPLCQRKAHTFGSGQEIH